MKTLISYFNAIENEDTEAEVNRAVLLLDALGETDEVKQVEKLNDLYGDIHWDNWEDYSEDGQEGDYIHLSGVMYSESEHIADYHKEEEIGAYCKLVEESADMLDSYEAKHCSN